MGVLCGEGFTIKAGKSFGHLEFEPQKNMVSVAKKCHLCCCDFALVFVSEALKIGPLVENITFRSDLN